MQYIKKDTGAGIGADKLEYSIKKTSGSTDRKRWYGGAAQTGVQSWRYRLTTRIYSRYQAVIKTEVGE